MNDKELGIVLNQKLAKADECRRLLISTRASIEKLLGANYGKIQTQLIGLNDLAAYYGALTAEIHQIRIEMMILNEEKSKYTAGEKYNDDEFIKDINSGMTTDELSEKYQRSANAISAKKTRLKKGGLI